MQKKHWKLHYDFVFFNAGNTRDYDEEEDERKQKVIKLKEKTVSIFRLHMYWVPLFDYTGILCYINWIIICRGSDYSK